MHTNDYLLLYKRIFMLLVCKAGRALKFTHILYYIVCKVYAEDILLLNEATRDYDTGSSEEEEKGHNSDGLAAKEKAAIYCIALPAGIRLCAQTHSLHILQVV